MYMYLLLQCAYTLLELVSLCSFFSQSVDLSWRVATTEREEGREGGRGGGRERGSMKGGRGGREGGRVREGGREGRRES